MKLKHLVNTRWFKFPTDLELGGLYLLSGIYIVIATNSVVPIAWYKFVIFSLTIVGIIICLRIFTFIFLLLNKNLKEHISRWCQLAIIVICMILIFRTNLDLILRVWISEGELYREVKLTQSIYDNNKQDIFKPISKPRGLFNIYIQEYDAKERTLWIHTVDGEEPFGSFSVLGGIVYCEQEKPPERGEAYYEHLYGPWWKWIQDM